MPPRPEKSGELEAISGLTAFVGAVVGMLRIRGALTGDDVNKARFLALQAFEESDTDIAERFIHMAADFSHSLREQPDPSAPPPPGSRRGRR